MRPPRASLPLPEFAAWAFVWQRAQGPEDHCSAALQATPTPTPGPETPCQRLTVIPRILHAPLMQLAMPLSLSAVRANLPHQKTGPTCRPEHPRALPLWPDSGSPASPSPPPPPAASTPDAAVLQEADRAPPQDLCTGHVRDLEHTVSPDWRQGAGPPCPCGRGMGHAGVIEPHTPRKIPVQALHHLLTVHPQLG